MDGSFSHQVAVALRLILCLTVMAAALGAVIAPTVIPWIFGVGFEGAVAPFQILLPGMVALALKTIIVKYITGLLPRPTGTEADIRRGACNS